MSWILHIDTSLETALVTIANDGNIISSRSNENQKNHASFLEPAIQLIAKEAGIQLRELSAIAVVYGPGSYTGLRVGMASVKGLCYALGKPMIVLNNLELLSIAAINEYKKTSPTDSCLFCPMVDARRMEVYTAVYDQKMNVILHPHAVILETESYSDLLSKNRIIFFGNGSDKWKTLCDDKNARFINPINKKEALVQLSFQKLAEQSFSSTAYTEPLYIKEFYSAQNSSKTD